MKIDIKKILKQFTKREKEPSMEFTRELRMRLEAYVKMNPLSAIPVLAEGVFPKIKFAIGFAMATIILILTGGGVGVFASQKSLPGNILYPVKLLVEDFRLKNAKNIIEESTLRAEFAAKRAKEIKTVLQTQIEHNDSSTATLEKALENFQTNTNAIIPVVSMEQTQASSTLEKINQDLKKGADDLNEAASLEDRSEIKNRIKLALEATKEIRKNYEDSTKKEHQKESGKNDN